MGPSQCPLTTRRGSRARGEKAAPTAGSGELLRAKALRKALEKGAPPTISRPSPRNGSAPPGDPFGPTLEDQKAFLEQIIENAPEAISIVDEESRILRINGEFTRLFGFTPEEAVGQSTDAIMVPPDRYAEKEWMKENL